MCGSSPPVTAASSRSGRAARRPARRRPSAPPAAVAGEAPLRAFLEGARPGLLDVTPAQIVEALDSLLPQPDRAVLSSELGEDLAAGLAHALEPGVEGWLAAALPAATVPVLPPAGHLSIADGRIGEILDELVAPLR
jgi:hypothetical protein